MLFSEKDLKPKVQEYWIPESKDGFKYTNMLTQICVGKGNWSSSLCISALLKTAHKSVTLSR